MRNNFNKLKREYDSLIQEVESAIKALIESLDVNEMAKHNAGYRHYGQDKFHSFIGLEKNRFIKILSEIGSGEVEHTICDLGTFIPYLPIALSILGHRVKIVDKYELYGEKFKSNVYRLAEKYNIELHDLDILTDSFNNLGSNDIVLLLAVVEHLNGSPENLMHKIKSIIRKNGQLIFEVPNIAEFIRRFKFLAGRSPLGNYADFYNSTYPYTGHNREMTMNEVRYLMSEANFTIQEIECYDYYRTDSLSLKAATLNLLKYLAPFKDKGQAIHVRARLLSQT